jgi:aminomethyltransferase
MSIETVVKRTPLFERHVELGARMGTFAGFEMPLWYSGVVAEHLAVRKQVGLFDLTHMGEVFVTGREAFDLLQYLTCNDLRRIGDGQCQYTLFPTPEGGVVDDLIVYQFNPEEYMLVVNASNTEKDYDWVTRHNHFDCQVVNRSAELTMVAVQGPLTDDLLRAFGLKNIAHQPAFSFRQLKVQSNKVIVAGTGYTGERGFELIVDDSLATWLWDRLLEVGQEFGAMPIGLGARDTLRLEMAYSLYGHELTDEISVLEANLAWAVRWGPDFIGREFLLQQRDEGAKRLITGLAVDKNQGAPRHSAPVYAPGGKDIGHITSGSFSPSLDKGIALALLPVEFSEPGSAIAVEIRGKRVAAKTCETPFYRRPK